MKRLEIKGQIDSCCRCTEIHWNMGYRMRLVDGDNPKWNCVPGKKTLNGTAKEFYDQIHPDCPLPDAEREEGE